MTTRQAGDLRTGDKVIEGTGGMEWAVADAKPVGTATVELTLDPVDAGMLLCKPERTVRRLRRTTLVLVP